MTLRPKDLERSSEINQVEMSFIDQEYCNSKRCTVLNCLRCGVVPPSRRLPIRWEEEENEENSSEISSLTLPSTQPMITTLPSIPAMMNNVKKDEGGDDRTRSGRIKKPKEQSKQLMEESKISYIYGLYICACYIVIEKNE